MCPVFSDRLGAGSTYWPRPAPRPSSSVWRECCYCNGIRGHMACHVTLTRVRFKLSAVQAWCTHCSWTTNYTWETRAAVSEKHPLVTAMFTEIVRLTSHCFISLLQWTGGQEAFGMGDVTPCAGLYAFQHCSLFCVLRINPGELISPCNSERPAQHSKAYCTAVF